MATNISPKRPAFWSVGHGGMVDLQRIVAIGLWASAPIRRAARQARVEGRLIDLTYGQATRWVIFLDSGHLVLASEPMPVAVGDLEMSYLSIHNDSEV
jgi:regulator of extracellular matrix RemA (YlzA/DUF370 family)